MPQKLIGLMFVLVSVWGLATAVPTPFGEDNTAVAETFPPADWATIQNQLPQQTVTEWTEQAKLTRDIFLGEAVAIDGDTAIFGASRGENDNGVSTGSAYIFVRKGNIWSEQAKLTPSDGVANGRFGLAVAISGHTVIVGAYDPSNPTEVGAAYIFTRNGTTWTEQAKLTASDSGFNEWFGRSVAIAGDTAVVGAMNNGQGRGAAYIFTRHDTTWTEQTKLTGKNTLHSDQFGFSVALDAHATTLVVGAWLANTSQGEIYVFTHNGTAWTEQAILEASDGAPSNQLGASVAIHDDTVVVGTWVVNNMQGAAYIFTRSGTTWTEQAKLTADDGVEGDRFGTSVAISGDTVIVGAPSRNTLQGAAYVFTRSGTMWNQQQELVASDGEQIDRFGYAVAINGHTAFVGAVGTDSVYLFNTPYRIYLPQVVR